MVGGPGRRPRRAPAPAPPSSTSWWPPAGGVVTRLDARAVGDRRLAARRRAGPQGGPGVGDGRRGLPGQGRRRVQEGQPLLELHTDDPAGLPAALAALADAVDVAGGPSRARNRHPRPRARSTRPPAEFRPAAAAGSIARMELPRPTLDQLRRAPKVLLHDHLDGGLRPDDGDRAGPGGRPPAARGRTPTSWPPGSTRAPTATTSTLYLETFAHTVGVLQTRDALDRVARECAEDLADDGVVYAEVRFAPELHTEGGLTLDEVVDAVRRGLRRRLGRHAPSRSARCCTAMRTAARSRDIAELAVRHRDDGVVGFDIAGAEAGHPPTLHLDAFQYVAAGELPHHDPRRGGVRAAVDLGGDPVLRGRAARPRRPHRRRHRGRPTTAATSWAGWPRSCATGGCRSRCAPPRTCTPARPPRSPSTPSGCCAGCASGSRSTPTTG